MNYAYSPVPPPEFNSLYSTETGGEKKSETTLWKILADVCQAWEIFG